MCNSTSGATSTSTTTRGYYAALHIIVITSIYTLNIVLLLRPWKFEKLHTISNIQEGPDLHFI
jgi:hypothetical protein